MSEREVIDGQVVGEDEGPSGRWVLLAEAEEAVGMSRSWLRKQINKGVLPYREVAGPTGPAYSVPLDRVRELARAGTERAQPAPASTADLARREDLTAEVDRLQAHFDAWTSRIEQSWHALALDLAEARARASTSEERARSADEAAGRLRAEVERLRKVELEAAVLRAEREALAQRRRWWQRRTEAS
jgi:hypothetical protein